MNAAGWFLCWDRDDRLERMAVPIAGCKMFGSYGYGDRFTGAETVIQVEGRFNVVSITTDHNEAIRWVLNNPERMVP